MPSYSPAMPSALSAFDGAIDWLNTEPLTAARLRGTVVAVQFCTYSCINWIRTIPYVRAWASAYRDDGLTVVGAHAPEFEFERELGGVRRALEAMGIQHPVVLDNDFAIWRSFDNHYWPALYLVDGDGNIAYEHFGEGAYRETEAAIRELVGARGAPTDVEATGVEAAADWDALGSPETYVGYAQSERHVGDAADALALNQWALRGSWTIEAQFGQLDAAPGSIAYRFEARDVNLVLTLATAGAPARFTLRLDGQPPGDAHGLDVDSDGEGAVTEPRLYQLVRQPGSVSARTVEITFHDPGVRAHVFTFG